MPTRDAHFSGHMVLSDLGFAYFLIGETSDSLNLILVLHQGHLTINRASFSSILIICSTNTFESKFAFIE